MIKNTKQRWEIGSQVKIGFLTGFTVLATLAVKDYMPDIYLLKRGASYYEFIPHNGLTKISAEKAVRWVR